MFKRDATLWVVLANALACTSAGKSESILIGTRMSVSM